MRHIQSDPPSSVPGGASSGAEHLHLVGQDNIAQLNRVTLPETLPVLAQSALTDALDALADHIALIDVVGNVIGVNKSWAEFAGQNGYDRGGTGLGENYCAVCDAAVGPGQEEALVASAGIRRVLAGNVDQFEQRYRCDSPTAERWYRMVVRRSARPGPIAAVIVHSDVTSEQFAARQRENLFASLETERAHLAAVFEQAPSFLAVFRGADHVYQRVNPAYGQLLGRSNMVGRTIRDVIPELCEQGFIEQLDRVRATGEPFSGRRLPVMLARTPGSPAEMRYIDLVYHRLDEPDGNHAIVSHGVDVTEHVLAHEALQRSEQRLREQLANLPVPTFLWEDRGGEFVLGNQNNAALAALPDSEAWIGKPASEIWPGVVDLEADLRSCLLNNIVVQRSMEVDAGSSGRRCFDVTMGPQQPDRVLMHAVDTTARSLLETQLRQAQKMEAIGQLAGGVAHDFNNLLTVISAHSAFLLDSLHADDSQRDDARAIHDAAARAAALTRQLLAFSRKQILKPQVMDLNACVTETRKMLDRLLREDIEISLELGSDLQHIVADPGQIGQVIVNLAVNARDAMESGGRLTISTALVGIGAGVQDTRGILLPGTYVRLAVADTGHGMDAEVQSRIFEPFFTTKELGKGTGLGLATVYGAVKQSGGYITVDSKPGGGTSFQVYFPAVPSEEERDQLQEAERAAERGVETILLIEDESVVREVAKRILKRHGYVVLEAANGQDALAVSAAFPSVIHLVISDAVMPGMPSTEAVRRLQERRPGLKAVFMSGYADDSAIARCVAHASAPLIHKPFTASDLARSVRNALDSPYRVESEFAAG